MPQTWTSWQRQCRVPTLANGVPVVANPVSCPAGAAAGRSGVSKLVLYRSFTQSRSDGAVENQRRARRRVASVAHIGVWEAVESLDVPVAVRLPLAAFGRGVPDRKTRVARIAHAIAVAVGVLAADAHPAARRHADAPVGLAAPDGAAHVQILTEVVAVRAGLAGFEVQVGRLRIILCSRAVVARVAYAVLICIALRVVRRILAIIAHIADAIGVVVDGSRAPSWVAAEVGHLDSTVEIRSDNALVLRATVVVCRTTRQVVDAGALVADVPNAVRDLPQTVTIVVVGLGRNP